MADTRIMHLIYPGMSKSVPVYVIEPDADPGFVLVLPVDGEYDETSVKVHCSRLNGQPVN